MKQTRKRKISEAKYNSFICNNIDGNSIIFTDSFKGYNKVNRYGYKHRKVNHSKTFVKANKVHTNTIESFWAYAKKLFRLTHGGVKKYFHKFLAKILFTFNHKCFIMQMKLLNKYLKFIN